MFSPATPGKQVANPDHGIREYVEVTTVEEVERRHSPENILASDGFGLFKYWAFSRSTTFELIR